MRPSMISLIWPLVLRVSHAQDLNKESIASLGLGHGSSCPQIAPGPLTTYDLATTFQPSAIEDATSIEAIRNTLALYAFAIDGRNFPALDRVFTNDAVANYSAPLGVLDGLDAIKAVLSAQLAQFVGTHHAYATQLIDVCSPSKALSVTYFTATHWFVGEVGSVVDDDQALYAYGRYEDTWERQRGGKWKIVYRNLVYMGPIVLNTP